MSYQSKVDLIRAQEEIASLRARIAELEEKLGECSDIKAWMNDVTVAERVEAGIQNANARGASIKKSSTREEAIRTAFTEIVRDAMAWARDETLIMAQSDRGEEDAFASDDELPHEQRSPDTNFQEPVK